MSVSPCSVPDWLRAIVPIETARQQRVCAKHDDRYAAGGSRWLRLVADLLFGLEEAGAPMGLCDALWLWAVEVERTGTVPADAMSADRAEVYTWAVRMYGGGRWTGGDGPGATPPREPTTGEAP